MTTTLLVRAFAADEVQARALISCLADEGLPAKLAATSPNTGQPVLFLWSESSGRDSEFRAEARAGSADTRFTVVLDGSYLGTADFDLSGWNYRDRWFAAFRNLVQACRRLLGLAHNDPLGLRDLASKRYFHLPEIARPVRRMGVGSGGDPFREPIHQLPGIGASDRMRWERFERPSLPASPPAKRAPTERSAPAAAQASAKPPPLPQATAPSRRRSSAFPPWLLWAAAAAGAAGLLYLGAKLGVLPSGLAKLFGAAMPPPGALGHKELREPVHVSAFSRETVPAGDEVLVQIYLHQMKDLDAVPLRAREADPESARRGTTSLSIAVASGQRIDVAIAATGLTVDEPSQYLIWRGKPQACQFLLSVPAEFAGRTAFVRATIMVDTIPVGSLRFAIKAVAGTQPAARYDIPPLAVKNYRRAFLSYASADRAEVLKRAQALRAAGISFFQDILNLEPGDRYERELFAEIDRCDLFLLFWSSHAAKSEWVQREAAYALKRQQMTTPEETPAITPVILEGPPVPLPPESLKHLHFNDALRYVIAAVEG
jgi:hypothetical protein